MNKLSPMLNYLQKCFELKLFKSCIKVDISLCVNMEVKVTDTNMYSNNNNVTSMENIFSMENENGDMDNVSLYEDDEDAFSDVNYDSDECSYELAKGKFSDESEDEFWEDEDEEDVEMSNEIRLRLLNEKDKYQLEGLSVLQGKLNWLDRVPVGESTLVDTDEYPILGAIATGAPRQCSSKENNGKKNTSNRILNRSPVKYIPSCINVSVGKKTHIQVEPVYCKTVQEGGQCAFGNKCRFSHDLPAPKIDYSTRICNFIRNGEKCKFGSRCKFSHDINILKKRKPSGDHKERKVGVKPMCRNGIKCENRRCTFTHPSGHKKTLITEQRPRNRTPNSSPQQKNKKFILCKNMFKVDSVISVNGKCSWGEKCMYAHSRNEVGETINNDLTQFQCSYGNACDGVKIHFITKKDKNGKDKKTRRYTNSGIHKCFKIHEKERPSDYIIRTNSLRA